jgi:hypothetical protein
LLTVGPKLEFVGLETIHDESINSKYTRGVGAFIHRCNRSSLAKENACASIEKGKMKRYDTHQTSGPILVAALPSNSRLQKASLCISAK